MAVADALKAAKSKRTVRNLNVATDLLDRLYSKGQFIILQGGRMNLVDTPLISAYTPTANAVAAARRELPGVIERQRALPQTKARTELLTALEKHQREVEMAFNMFKRHIACIRARSD